MDKASNFWSEPVTNLVKFYDYKNYVPYKGRLDSENHIDFTNPRSISKELVEAVQPAGGRISDSDNPVLQVMVDAAKAAMRVGRRDVSQSIVNAIKQGHILGEPVGIHKDDATVPDTQKHVIKFGERINFEWGNFQGPNKIFNYLPNGDIQVYQIKDPNMAEAIRRSFEKDNPFVLLANKFTSAIGSMHTRYNPAFAPMNYTRDALTNSFAMAYDMGPKEAASYIGLMAKRTYNGGMYTSLKVASLYAKNDVAGIEKLAKTDPFANSIKEYLETGGRVSYLQGIAIQGQLDELLKTVGKSGIMKSKQELDKYIDIYNDMFELTSRATAYEIAKGDALSRKLPEADAKIEAAVYAKNLANFEQVGNYGKLAGALFMFFRPSATGAVRAMDSIAPIWQNVNDLINAMPESIRNDKEAVDKFRKDHAERKKRARVVTGSIAGAGAAMYFMALAMAGKDDEDRNKSATDDMSRWVRYVRLPIPGTDKFFQMPWGFGGGAFASAGAQIAAAASGNQSVGDMVGNLTQVALDSFLPIPVSRMNPIDNPLAWVVDSAAPSVARPFIEYVMNTNSMGNSIYNNRQSRFGDAYTGGNNVPEIYKAASRAMLQGTVGVDQWPFPIDVSPNSLYFFANNYADGVFRVAQTAGDIAYILAGAKDADIKAMVPVISSFIGEKSNYDARQYSKIEAKITDKEKILKELEADPDNYIRYIEAHPMDMAVVATYNKLKGSMLDPINKIANGTRRRQDMTPRERTDMLKDIEKNQNAIKAAIVGTFRDLDVTP